MTFTLTLENEGNIADSYILSQSAVCGGKPGLIPNMKVLVMDDASINHDITSQPWTTPSVPAKVNDLSTPTLPYTLKAEVPGGEATTCDITLRIDSYTKGAVLDSLLIAVNIINTSKVDLWIDGSGDNVYGLTGSGNGGQVSKDIPGGIVGSFTIGVQNEGNIADRYTLSLSSTLPEGWSAVISETLSDGSEALCPLPCTIPTATAGNPFSYQPGEVPFFKLKVAPDPQFSSGSPPVDIIIDVVSVTQGNSAEDSVRAAVTAGDITPPASVILNNGTVTSTSIQLTWTAPGDDGNTGQATSYDLRYSTSPIDENNFSSATPVQGLPPPQINGSDESIIVDRLFANTVYYFALKTKDEVGNSSLISTCPGCPGQTSPSTDFFPPGTVSDLRVTQATQNTITLCWTAPAEDGEIFTVLFDDFSDGTLAPWSQLQSGVVNAVNDPADGWLLRKTTNLDPNGGWAPLAQTVGDFEVVLYTKRLTNVTVAAFNRYSVTDADGNGYGLYLSFIDGTLHMEKRTAWTASEIGAGSAVSGGVALGQWYTLRLTRNGNSLTAETFAGKVDPATATPAATVTAADETWGSFIQVNVNGGYDYDTDNVQVRILPGGNGSSLATGYLLHYSTKSIVDDGDVLGMGEIYFKDADSTQGMGLPKSPGFQECYAVRVWNKLAGLDGIRNTPDDVDLTPSTQFFFAVKAEDENHNKGAISNVVSGLTAMTPNTYNLVSVPKVPDPNYCPDPLSVCPNPPSYDPANVFGDDALLDKANPNSFYLYRWDSLEVGHTGGCYDHAGLAQLYDPYNKGCSDLITNIESGKSYFLWTPRLDLVLDAPAGSVDTPPNGCQDANGLNTCYAFPLQVGWNMIDNPFGKEVDVRSIQVQPPGGGTPLSFPDAADAGWVEGAVYTYNGVYYPYEVCDRSGLGSSIFCNAVLQSWKGYWIWLKRGDGNYNLLIPEP